MRPTVLLLYSYFYSSIQYSILSVEIVQSRGYRKVLEYITAAIVLYECCRMDIMYDTPTLYRTVLVEWYRLEIAKKVTSSACLFSFGRLDTVLDIPVP